MISSLNTAKLKFELNQEQGAKMVTADGCELGEETLVLIVGEGTKDIFVLPDEECLNIPTTICATTEGTFLHSVLIILIQRHGPLCTTLSTFLSDPLGWGYEGGSIRSRVLFVFCNEHSFGCGSVSLKEFWPFLPFTSFALMIFILLCLYNY